MGHWVLWWTPKKTRKAPSDAFSFLPFTRERRKCAGLMNPGTHPRGGHYEATLIKEHTWAHWWRLPFIVCADRSKSSFGIDTEPGVSLQRCKRARRRQHYAVSPAVCVWLCSCDMLEGEGPRVCSAPPHRLHRNYFLRLPPLSLPFLPFTTFSPSGFSESLFLHCLSL